MPGYSDYASKNGLNYITGQIAQPALPAVFLALFTTAPSSDAGTGGTEVSGGSYARVQVAGTAATNNSTATSSNTLHFASTPSWITANMEVYDTTSGAPVGVVASTTTNTVVLTTNALNAVGNGDNLSFSAFSNAFGSSPASVTTNTSVSFATPTANWGTVTAFGLYDALTAGDLLAWDYLGNYAWLPAFITSASPAAFDVKAHGYNAGDSIVYYTEFGGTAPTGITAGNALQTVGSSPATDSFNIGVNTSSTGSGMVRKVASQVVSTNVVVTFAAGSLTMMAT